MNEVKWGVTIRRISPQLCYVSVFSGELFLYGSANRASACTCATLETLVSVDNILAVLFCDALNGTFRSTSTATDAIVSNLICHDKYLRIKIL